MPPPSVFEPPRVSNRFLRAPVAAPPGSRGKATVQALAPALAQVVPLDEDDLALREEVLHVELADLQNLIRALRDPTTTAGDFARGTGLAGTLQGLAERFECRYDTTREDCELTVRSDAAGPERSEAGPCYLQLRQSRSFPEPDRPWLTCDVPESEVETAPLPLHHSELLELEALAQRAQACRRNRQDQCVAAERGEHHDPRCTRAVDPTSSTFRCLPTLGTAPVGKDAPVAPLSRLEKRRYEGLLAQALVSSPTFAPFTKTAVLATPRRDRGALPISLDPERPATMVAGSIKSQTKSRAYLAFERDHLTKPCPLETLKRGQRYRWYQQVLAIWACRQGQPEQPRTRWFVFGSPGVGKTLTMVLMATCFRQRIPQIHALFLAPLSIVRSQRLAREAHDSWKGLVEHPSDRGAPRMLTAYAGIGAEALVGAARGIETSGGAKKPLQGLLDRLWVGSYGSIRRLSANDEYLLRNTVYGVALDEPQGIHRTLGRPMPYQAAVIRLCRDARYCGLYTGTPFRRRLVQMAVQLHILNPRRTLAHFERELKQLESELWNLLSLTRGEVSEAAKTAQREALVPDPVVEADEALDAEPTEEVGEAAEDAEEVGDAEPEVGGDAAMEEDDAGETDDEMGAVAGSERAETTGADDSGILVEGQPARKTGRRAATSTDVAADVLGAFVVHLLRVLGPHFFTALTKDEVGQAPSAGPLDTTWRELRLSLDVAGEGVPSLGPNYLEEKGKDFSKAQLKSLVAMLEQVLAGTPTQDSVAATKLISIVEPLVQKTLSSCRAAMKYAGCRQVRKHPIEIDRAQELHLPPYHEVTGVERLTLEHMTYLAEYLVLCAEQLLAEKKPLLRGKVLIHVFNVTVARHVLQGLARHLTTNRPDLLPYLTLYFGPDHEGDLQSVQRNWMEADDVGKLAVLLISDMSVEGVDLKPWTSRATVTLLLPVVSAESSGPCPKLLQLLGRLDRDADPDRSEPPPPLKYPTKLRVLEFFTGWGASNSWRYEPQCAREAMKQRATDRVLAYGVALCRLVGEINLRRVALGLL